MTPNLRERVGDLRQLASVRGVVLQDGPEAGVRALLFSTGGGLDFSVLIDRSLDIGTLHYRGVPVAWQSPGGFRAPSLIDREGDGMRGFGRGFSGFLVTCGLDHIRQPAAGQPLHGRLPFTPARLLAAGEDWDAQPPRLFCEGEIVQYRQGAECFRMIRRIEAPIGGTALTIADRVVNEAEGPWPHAILYHFNIGYPAFTPESTLTLDGIEVHGPSTPADLAPTARCLPAPPGATAVLRAGPDPAGFAMTLDSDGSLPWFQVWSAPQPRARVLSLEPCSCPLGPAGTNLHMETLPSGEPRHYRLNLTFTGTAPSILPDMA